MGRSLLLLTVAVAGTLVPLLNGQTPDQKPLAFAAASIKQSAGPTASGTVSPDRFFRSNATLLSLLTYAYDLNAVQIQGGDQWTRDSRFYVDAKAEGRPTDEQMRAMVREMLADRFKLKTHSEAREVSRYALIKARSDGRLGDKIRPSVVDCRDMSSITSEDLRAARASDRWACTRRMLLGGPGTVTLITHGYALADFAWTLQTRAGRAIVDKTGLTGAYDIELETEGPQIPGQASTASPEGLSLFTALQEQLGLKLESERGHVEVLVIDHVERPTPD